MIKQLSDRALKFIEKQERNKEYEVDLKILENHLNFYHLQNSNEILRFQEKFSGLSIQNTVFHIFTPKQINENKGVNTYHWNGQVLFSIADGFYISENGEVAFRDCGCDSYDFFFYYESFETFIEQEVFFAEHQYYKYIPALLGYDVVCDISLISKYFSDYDFVKECSDKYHRMWKNNLNLVHARLYPEGWIIFFDGQSENERHNLIEKLKKENIIA